jgi:hypothetical protein
MAEHCDHKFVDSSYCAKCGVHVDKLRGGQRWLATGDECEPRRRRRPLRRFACESLRGGWVVGWMIDGKRIDQRPQMRVEANAPLVLRADADHVVAIFALSDHQPPCLLELGGESQGEQIGGAQLSWGRR